MAKGRMLIFRKNGGVLTEKDLEGVARTVETIKYKGRGFEGFMKVMIFNGRAYVGYETNLTIIFSTLEEEIIKRMERQNYEIEERRYL